MMIIVDDQEYEVEDGSPVAKVVRWLLTEAAPVLERGDVNWKVIVHGSRQDLKPVLEIYHSAL